LQFVPQIAFVAACAGAVFWYVFTHIDEIRERQRVVIEQTMDQQSRDINDAQSTQRRKIEEARKKQEAAIQKIQDDAARREGRL
jgi:hypothetical protein